MEAKRLFNGDAVGAPEQCLERVQFVDGVYSEWFRRVRDNNNGKHDGNTVAIDYLMKGGISPKHTIIDTLSDIQCSMQNADVSRFHHPNKEEDNEKDSVCDGASCFIMKRQERPRNGQKWMEIRPLQFTRRG